MKLYQLLSDAPLPSLEAKMLMQLVTGLSRVQLLTRDTMTLSATQLAHWHHLCARRCAGEPMAYLVGEREFYGRVFQVNAHVLIPRPDTETLIDAVLADLDGCAQGIEALNVLDMGTGSGVIAVTLAAERPHWRVCGCDISDAAVEVARANGKRLGVSARFFVGDWWEAVAPLSPIRFDVVVSNPPYIEHGDAHLQQGDLRFEPLNALTDGADGLAHYRTIMAQASQYVQPRARIYFEHGHQQGAAVRGILSAAGCVGVRTLVDLGGHDRVSCGIWP